MNYLRCELLIGFFFDLSYFIRFFLQKVARSCNIFLMQNILSRL